MTANDAEKRADPTAEETQRERAAGLTPASENPWYLLATVAGEQTEDEFDEERHARNLRFWNGWACQNLSDEQRHELAADARIEAANLAHWNADERKLVEDIFRKRQLKIPSVDQKMILQSTFFSRPVFMQSFIFPSSVSFSYSKFARMAFFKNAVFISAAEFEQAVFLDLELSGTKFGDSVRFTDACITRSWDFSSARFFGQTHLDQMELRGGVYGYNVEFHGITFFEKTGFLSVTNFSRIDFFNHVSFLQTNFGHTMNFHHCQFHKSCDFGPDWVSDTVIPTHFGQHTTFFNCEFFDFSDFRHSVSEYVSFTKTKFKGFADFSNATFEQRCDFSDCRFEHPTKFRNAKFKTSFPIFSGAILHQVTIFTAKEECWPVATEAPTEESRGSLAIIRHTVGKQGLPEDEHYFFRREMAFAARIGSPLQRLPYQAFGALSDFGYSLAKPTLWLAAVWFVGFLGYSRWLLRLDAPLSDTPAAVTAAGFSVAQLFGFLGFTGSYFGTDFLDALPTALKVLAACQTVAGVVLLFFLGLGLRNRFRLK